MVFKKTIFLYALIFLAFNSCIEPFDYKTLTFESALVVEASISSENKRQTIKLSRTFKIENSDMITETGATVQVIDDQKNTYNFTEETPENYISDVFFEAKQQTIERTLLTSKK